MKYYNCILLLLTIFSISETICQKNCKINNLWVNGDFESRDSSCLVLNPVNKKGPAAFPNYGYWTFRNKAGYYVQPSYVNEMDKDHTTGSSAGHYFYLDPRSNSGYTYQFYQEINVKKNGKYNFSMWYSSMNLSTSLPGAPITIKINGTKIINDFTIANDAETWKEVKGIWNSGSDTVAKITLEVFNPQIHGMDFAVDDIYFGSSTDSIRAFAGLDKQACSNTEVVLGGKPTANYGATCNNQYQFEWLPASHFIGSNKVANPKVIIPTVGKYTYWVKLFDKNNNYCIDTINIDIQSTKIMNNFLPEDTVFCGPFNLTLIAPSGFTNYEWSDGSKNQQISISKAGRYSIKLNNGCQILNDTIKVEQDSFPKNILGNDTIYCNSFKREYNFTNNNYFNYKYSSNWNIIRPNFEGFINKEGIFKLEYENKCGRTIDSIIVLQHTLPESINIKDTIFCKEILLQLSLNRNSTETILWSTGEVTKSINILQPGKYWVRCENGCGVLSDTFTISRENKPISKAKLDTTVCKLNQLLLQPSTKNINYKYLWSTNDTTPYLNISTPGIYFLKVSNSCGFASDTFIIKLDSNQFLNLGPDHNLCEKQDVKLSVKPVSLKHFIWNNGSSSKDIIVNNFGKYWVTTNSNCGIFIDTVTILNRSITPFSLGKDTAICMLQGLELTAPIQAKITTWSNGATGSKTRIKNPGIHWLEVCNDYCCFKDSISISSTSSGADILHIPSAFTPDGNNLNDLFPHNNSNFDFESFIILNRWGEIIFKQSSQSKFWDGTVPQSKKLAQEGVYVYLISYKDCSGVKKHVKGNFTLLR